MLLPDLSIDDELVGVTIEFTILVLSLCLCIYDSHNVFQSILKYVVVVHNGLQLFEQLPTVLWSDLVHKQLHINYHLLPVVFNVCRVLQVFCKLKGLLLQSLLLLRYLISLEATCIGVPITVVVVIVVVILSLRPWLFSSFIPLGLAVSLMFVLRSLLSSLYHTLSVQTCSPKGCSING